MKTLTCRAHGGTFQVTPSRGRPPVNCGGKWGPCSRSGNQPTRVERVASQIKNARMDDGHSRTDGAYLPPRAIDEERIRKAEGGPVMPAAPLGRKISASLAMAAKVRLESLNWLCKGRAFTDANGDHAELIATRGEETISLFWLNGMPPIQDYHMWFEKPSANGKPADSLTFDPDECTDRELVRALSGMKVTWWNALGQKEETAVVDALKIQIEHCYNGTGEESPGDRIVKFNDHAGKGSRAFRVAALLKVG